MKKNNTDLVGDLAEGIAVVKLMRLGYLVSKPINKCRYDLLVDDAGDISRVQVKKGNVTKDYIEFRTTSVTAGGKKRKQYTADEIEYFLVVNIDDNDVYMVDVNDCSKEKQRLRLTETRNGQSKGILFAEDYILRE